MPTDQLEELETKIGRLLEKHLKIKREKEVIERQLSQKETELHHLLRQLRKYEKERGELRQKLEKMLLHLEDLGLT